MFDRIIVSTDENPDFIYFLPIVSKAWNKFFPEVPLSVAFVTNRTGEDDLVATMKQYAEVETFKPVDGIPTSNHAKVARHLLAARFGSDVCMLEDIDTIPLQREFFEERTSHYRDGKLVAVGREVYAGTPHSNNFPMSTITTTGDIFREIVGHGDDTDIVKSFVGHNIYSIKEDISKPYPFFSDEYLFRPLIEQWGGEVVHVNRDVNPKVDWIDRSWWSIDEDKLNRGEYVTCNFLRNMIVNFKKMKPVVDYIYGKQTKIEEVLL